jgi:beta-lactam-binding protein with PASTA domain
MGFTMDFETGDLRGWEKAGDAFDYQPTLGDNLTARGLGEPSNQQGSYWIGTFERFQGRPGQHPGGVQGDGPQGILTSAAFVIPAGTLSFLVGGGSRFETRVELVIVEDPLQETRIYYQSGKDSDTMERVTWDLRPYAGRIGRIRIVDASSQEWGHINVDDFRFEGNVAVPDVVGRNLKEAKKIFAAAGLELGQVTKVSSEAEPNTVVQQDPNAETEAPIGTQVNLTVAQKEMVAVPDLRGRSQAEAEDLLKNKQLHSGEVVKRFSYQPEGSVVLQDPVAGTRVPVGAAVDLWVAASAPVKVPDVRGLRIKEVEKILQAVRLHVGEVSKRLSYQPEGTVVRQEPGAGTRAAPDSSVDVYVASTDRVDVPDLRGLSQSEAQELLKEARLTVGRIHREPANLQENLVISQDPAMGTAVPVGSGVRLWVTVRTAMVKVPDLAGRNSDQARAILESMKLRLGEIVAYSSEQQKGTVLGQDPAAGAEVPAGTAVTIWAAAERPRYARKQRGILTAAIIVLAIGLYLLVRFSHAWAMSLGRAGRRVGVLVKRTVHKRKNRTR